MFVTSRLHSYVKTYVKDGRNCRKMVLCTPRVYLFYDFYQVTHSSHGSHNGLRRFPFRLIPLLLGIRDILAIFLQSSENLTGFLARGKKYIYTYRRKLMLFIASTDDVMLYGSIHKSCTGYPEYRPYSNPM